MTDQTDSDPNNLNRYVWEENLIINDQSVFDSATVGGDILPFAFLST